MNIHERKIQEIEEFINNYTKWSQSRGKMYGTISELESNWKLLDNIFFILHNLCEEMNNLNFSAFLRNKGFGTKSATLVINEKKADNPYNELNNLWNEYLEWRTKLLRNSEAAR